jgi:hypothetical protein
MYDPAGGRFLQRDLFGGVKQSPITLDRFIYGLDNPVTLRESTGLFCTGATIGGTVEAGLAGPGFAATGSGGPVGCYDTNEGVSAGGFLQGGAFLNGFSGQQYGEHAEAGNTAAGAFYGGGAGPFVSNAKTPEDLAGPFDTVSLDVSLVIVPIKISVQVGVSGNIWMTSLTAGPGEGLAASRLVTTTLVAWVGQHKKK